MAMRSYKIIGQSEFETSRKLILVEDKIVMIVIDGIGTGDFMSLDSVLARGYWEESAGSIDLDLPDPPQDLRDRAQEKFFWERTSPFGEITR